MPKSFLVKKPSRNKRKLEEERYDGKYLYCYSNTQAQRNLSLPKVSALSELRSTKLRRELGFYLRHRVSKRRFVEFCLIFFLDFFNFCFGESPRFVGSARPTQQD